MNRIYFNLSIQHFNTQFNSMKKVLFILAAMMTSLFVQAKTLVVYYSYTNNIHNIVSDLQTQIDADVVRIEPTEKGLDYAANNYAIGSALISAIRNNPNDASSYPAIDPVNVNFDEYNIVIVAAPLWWSNMAAPMQTFLFENGAKMAGKKIGLIVSSGSSGISGVEEDAHRLIPEGDFIMPSLWIRSSQTSNCHSMVSNWLEQIDYSGIASGVKSVSSDMQVNINVTANAIHVDGEFDSLALYDISGHKMLESSDNTIGTSALTSGIYIARIGANLQSVSKKIVINK